MLEEQSFFMSDILTYIGWISFSLESESALYNVMKANLFHINLNFVHVVGGNDYIRLKTRVICLHESNIAHTISMHTFVLIYIISRLQGVIWRSHLSMSFKIPMKSPPPGKQADIRFHSSRKRRKTNIDVIPTWMWAQRWPYHVREYFPMPHLIQVVHLE